MTRRLLALVRKELREHAWTGLGLFALLAFVLAISLLAAFARGAFTLLDVHALFTRLGLPVTAAVLAHRLIVREYHGGTQHFLEALPVRRAEWVLLKFGLGLLITVGLGLASLAMCGALASEREPIDRGFLLLLAARTTAWTAAVWSFFLVTGASGKMRWAIYVASGLALFTLQSLTSLELSRMPPFSLVDETFVLERAGWPVSDLLATAGLAGAMLGVAVCLTLLKEGSFAESLSKRMTQKEKTLFALVFVAYLSLWSTYESRLEKEPYEMQGAEILKSEQVALQINTSGLQEPEAAEGLLGILERDLVEFERWVEWDDLPPAFLSHRSDLDGRLADVVALSDAEGVLLRFNLDAASLDPEPLRFALLKQLVFVHSDGRSDFEPKAWLTDGLLRWWVEHHPPASDDRPRSAPDSERASRSLIRGLWALREVPVSAALLERWALTRERFGPEVAEGLAHTGVHLLEAKIGRDGVHRLALAFLSEWPPTDARSLLHELQNPAAELFEEATGIPWTAFLEDWNRDAQRLLADTVAAELEQVPRASAEIAIEQGEGAIRDVRWRAVLDRPAEVGAFVSLVHYPLDPIDTGPVAPLDLYTHEQRWPEGQLVFESVLQATYGVGDRALLAIELESPALRVPVRLAARRVTFE